MVTFKPLDDLLAAVRDIPEHLRGDDLQLAYERGHAALNSMRQIRSDREQIACLYREASTAT